MHKKIVRWGFCEHLFSIQTQWIQSQVGIGNRNFRYLRTVNCIVHHQIYIDFNQTIWKLFDECFPKHSSYFCLIACSNGECQWSIIRQYHGCSPVLQHPVRNKLQARRLPNVTQIVAVGIYSKACVVKPEGTTMWYCPKECHIEAKITDLGLTVLTCKVFDIDIGPLTDETLAQLHVAVDGRPV